MSRLGDTISWDYTILFISLRAQYGYSHKIYIELKRLTKLNGEKVNQNNYMYVHAVRTL